MNNGIEDADFDSGHTFKVETLHAIALAQFIAYDVRPKLRQKGATDTSNLVVLFFIK